MPLVGPSSGAGSVIGQPGIYSAKASYADEVNQLFSRSTAWGCRVSRCSIRTMATAATCSTAPTRAGQVQGHAGARSPYDRITGNVEPAVNEMLKVDTR